QEPGAPTFGLASGDDGHIGEERSGFDGRERTKRRPFGRKGQGNETNALRPKRGCDSPGIRGGRYCGRGLRDIDPNVCDVPRSTHGDGPKTVNAVRASDAA